jgi:hypothetical protein
VSKINNLLDTNWKAQKGKTKVWRLQKYQGVGANRSLEKRRLAEMGSSKKSKKRAV